MTSQSHKKRPTTRPNTARSSRPSVDREPVARVIVLGLIGLAVLASATWAEDARPSGVEAGETPRMDASAAERRWAELRALYLGEPAKTPRSVTPETHVARPRPTEDVAITPTPSDDGKVWTRLDNFPGAASLETRPADEPVTDSHTPFAASSSVSPVGAVLSEDPADADRFLRPIETSLPLSEAPAERYLAPGFEDTLIRDELPMRTAQLPAGDLRSDIRIGPDISARLELKPLSAIVPSKDYAPSGEDACQFACPAPADCPDARCPDQIDLPTKGNPERYFGETMYHWAASNVRYNPLYFEDARLERYGHHIAEPLQSIKSVGLFAAQFASLPYQMAIDPVHESVSPLGFYRPGEAAPCLKRAIPVNKKAAAAAAGVYTGLIFLIP